MPTPTAKTTLSPAELAKLEHAFAADPASDAYKALAEAYLGMGRFMEAMVVCKKGVKAHPNAAEPRVLLARVYADQGKDKKALEELNGAVAVAPSDKSALRMLGALQLKGGETEAGKASLLKAFESDPADAQTVAEMEKWGVPVPAPAAPPAPAPVPVASEPVSAPVAAAAPPVLSPVQPAAGPPVLAPAQPVVTQPVAAAAPPAQVHSQPVAAAPRPAARPQPRPAARPVAADWDEPVSEEVDVAPRRKQAPGKAKYMFFALLAIAPLSIGGYSYWTKATAERNREIKKLLDVAADELKHDSYSCYLKAADAAAKVLDKDASSVAAHGYLAYTWAVVWGEHGGGDDARRRAEEHLALAKKGGEANSHLFAAEALFKAYSGAGVEAAKELETRTLALEKENKRSSLLRLTLGLIQMNSGDLDRAKDSLDIAQALASSDPRVYGALGTLFRRKGMDGDASKNFGFALKISRQYEKDHPENFLEHPESLLGRALLLLEQENAQFYVEASKLIRKLVDANPPPSPRQLAAAHLARAFLYSRVSNEVGYYKAEFQKELLDGTGVPGDKKRAQEALAKDEDTGFSLDRQNPELHLIKGRRLFLEGDHEGAVAEIRKAIAMDKSRAQFYVELARALMGKPGGEKEAQEALITAIKTMGNSPKLVLMLGQAYRRQGDSDKALAQFQLALGDGKAKAPDARLAMGTIYREKKDYTKAAELLDRAAQEFVGQGARVAASYTELARVHEENGQREKAFEFYQRALKADDEYPDAYYFVARYLSADRARVKDSKEFAREYLKRAPKGEFVADAQRLAQ